MDVTSEAEVDAGDDDAGGGGDDGASGGVRERKNDSWLT